MTYRAISGRRICCRFFRLEIAADDSAVDQIIEVLTKAASTGKIGDGKIFVSDLEQVIRIRTGESGPDAL